MLISLTVENYRSFAEAQTLSLVAGRDSTHKETLVDCGNFSLLRAAAVFGANASGKSNLVKAVQFMQLFVRLSATELTLGDPISDAEPFRLDASWRNKPCSFEIRVLLNGTEYQYGFSATKQRVCDEWLFVRRPGSKAANPLLRRLDPETGRTDWKLRGQLARARDVADKTRDNGLFLSRAAEMNVEFVKELFLWFRNRLWCFDLAEPRLMSKDYTAKLVAENQAIRRRVEKLVHDADLGIDRIAAEKRPVELPENAPEAARPIVSTLKQLVTAIETLEPQIQALEPGFSVNDFLLTRYNVRTFHTVAASDRPVEFSLTEESYGTQRFFALLGPVLSALDQGSLVVVDELDCSMHPLLTRKIIELFQSPESNPKGAQLVFATHDTTLMDKTLLRRDQIWLTEKTSKGATQLFSLADLQRGRKPRKEEALEKNYLAGRYGGIPMFGPAIEDLEVQ